jgi:hypothetical protein
MKKTKLKLVLFFAVLLLGLSPSSYAQGGPSEGPEPPPQFEEDGPEPPPSAPINEALPLLAIVGAYFVYKKVYVKY